MYRHKVSTMYPIETSMKLANSASEQNVFFTYVCLVNDINPTDGSSREHDYDRLHRNAQESKENEEEDSPIQIQRTKALHEIVEIHRQHEHLLHEKPKVSRKNETDSHKTNSPQPATIISGDDSELSEGEEFIGFDNPNVLRLTKMKWLTEEQPGSPDSSSPSLSPARSTASSLDSQDSDGDLRCCFSSQDKYLSTILRLDKEHNLFGLSNIAIAGPMPSLSRRARKDPEKPAFPQTAIVQLCCTKKCCRYRSKTDLPSSLKCGGCSSCSRPIPCLSCTSTVCGKPCGSPCGKTCGLSCRKCPYGTCVCKVPCRIRECGTCDFGVKIQLNRKTKYPPEPVELTPRSSCIMHKPMMARTCTHTPHCIPPSSCFPYLMPCYWPSRPSAPCNEPARCFHNPPCLRKRQPKSYMPSAHSCPKGKPCSDPKGTSKGVCPSIFCPSKYPDIMKQLEAKYGNKTDAVKSPPTSPKDKTTPTKAAQSPSVSPTASKNKVKVFAPPPMGM